MTALTQPARLKKGDTVALLSPSGPCDMSRIEPAALALEGFGFRPQVMESCRSCHGYLAGTDAIRAKDIMEAFINPAIKGIFALRGGYGAARLLPLLDYGRIGKHPKIFAGYSDITALHTAFNQRCGFITYHAPMAGTELYMKNIDDFTLSSFLGNLMEERSPPELRYIPVIPGNVSGILTGGNLSLLISSIGTPYEINTRDKILFIEEVQEDPYRVDRMFLQLKQAGKLNDCRAILLGSFLPETSKTISQAIEELLVPLGKPLGIDLSCGHCLPTATLPLGAMVCMDDGRMVF
ncbi:MAG: LD-carboxypeptidase [Defluviitaleaceae bacterium]|nr:LD-carboxypeptidase [Defluviitaleaceae bacterium]